MTMNNTSKIFGILFLIGGLGLIIAAYFLFLKDVQEEDLFYLNMIATCVVFSIVFLRAFDLSGSVDKVGKSGAGLGLKWSGVAFYTPLALALIICSIVLGLSFKFCLIGHLLLLFILLIFFFLGSLAKNNANEVIGNIEARKSGLKEIASQIDLLEMYSKLGNGPSCQEAIDKLREEIRFITASDNPVAMSLENKLLERIRLISSQLEHSSQSADVLNAEFKECMSIIELRKKQY